MHSKSLNNFNKKSLKVNTSLNHFVFISQFNYRRICTISMLISYLSEYQSSYRLLTVRIRMHILLALVYTSKSVQIRSHNVFIIVVIIVN